MSGNCNAELCEMWNGDVCVCSVMDGDPDAIDDMTRWINDLSNDDGAVSGG